MSSTPASWRFHASPLGTSCWSGFAYSAVDCLGISSSTENGRMPGKFFEANPSGHRVQGMTYRLLARRALWSVILASTAVAFAGGCGRDTEVVIQSSAMPLSSKETEIVSDDLRVTARFTEVCIEKPDHLHEDPRAFTWRDGSSTPIVLSARILFEGTGWEEWSNRSFLHRDRKFQLMCLSGSAPLVGSRAIGLRLRSSKNLQVERIFWRSYDK